MAYLVALWYSAPAAMLLHDLAVDDVHKVLLAAPQHSVPRVTADIIL